MFIVQETENIIDQVDELKMENGTCLTDSDISVAEPDTAAGNDFRPGCSDLVKVRCCVVARNNILTTN